MSSDRSVSTGIQIDWCPREKLSELKGFIDASYRPGHILSRDSDLLSWQYRIPHDPGNLSILLAQGDQDILGFLGLIQVRFNRYGESLPAAWLATWCTAQHVRSRRVGLTLLRDALQRPFHMIGCLGFNDTTKRILGGLRFDLRDSLYRWVRVITPSALESLLGEADEHPSSPAWKTWNDTAQSKEIANPATTKSLDWSEEAAGRWDQAWKKRFAAHMLGTWRDSEYLRWRYVDHPGFRYVLHFAEDTATGALTGVLVYRVEKVRDRNVKIMRVVEFLGDGDAGDALAQMIKNEGDSEGVAFADFYCTSVAFAEPLEKAGFVREDAMPSNLPNLFQPLEFQPMPLNGAFMVKAEVAGDNHDFFDSPDLYITRSDCDQDRPN